MLYHSIGASYIRYGIASWGSAKPSALKKLQTLQNKIVGYITHSPQSPNISLHFKALGILTVDEIYTQEIAKFMYKYHNFSLPAAFDGYFRNISHSHNTRLNSDNNLSYPKTRTNLGKSSLKYIGAKVWNDLDLTIQNAKTIEIFNDLVKKHLIAKRALSP